MTLWDAQSGQALLRLAEHEGIVSALAFSRDGRLLAVATWNGTVTIWDAGSGIPSLRIPLASPVTAVQFSPDGELLYSRSVDGTIDEWKVIDGTLARRFQAPA